MSDDASRIRDVLADAGLAADGGITRWTARHGSTSRLYTLAVAGTPLVAKIADDPAILERTSREATVLDALAESLAGLAPRLIAARTDAVRSIVILERIDGRVGDPVAGAAESDLVAIIDRLAPVWSLDASDPRVAALGLPEWGRGSEHARPHRRRAERFRRRVETTLTRFPDDPDLPRRLAAVADRFERLAETRRRGASRLIHGDLHLGNVVFTADGPRVVDWQTTSLGDPLDDVVRLVMESAAQPSLADLHRIARRIPGRNAARAEVATAAILAYAGFVTGLAGRPELPSTSSDHRFVARLLGPAGIGPLIDDALADLDG